jgi:hypothetical protein
LAARSASISRATESVAASPPRGPMIWMPNGNPAPSRPAGIATTGCPALVAA